MRKVDNGGKKSEGGGRKENNGGKVIASRPFKSRLTGTPTGSCQNEASHTKNKKTTSSRKLQYTNEASLTVFITVREGGLLISMNVL